MNYAHLECRYYQAFATYTACNMVLVVATLYTYIALTTAGFGILEVKAYLNAIYAPSILVSSTLFVNVSDIIEVILYVCVSNY